MVNATIDNVPVSIQLDNGQSTTVPSNETWKVTISLYGTQGDSNADFDAVRINGVEVLGISGDKSNGGAVSSPTASFVLAGGDSVRPIGTVGDEKCAIQGFVVDS